MNKKISLFDKIGYGTGNFSYGIIFQLIGTYMVFYATAVLGIPGSLIGTTVSLSVMWDAVSDPLMGYISDITKFKKYGRRHLYILAGCIAIAVFNYLLWAISPQWTTSVKFLFILLYLILVKTFMTVYITPYTALGAELSNDYNERTSIQGIRTIFFLLGLMFATVMGMFLFFKPSEQYPQGQLNPEAYLNMAVTSSLLALFFGMFCFFTTKKFIPYLPTAQESNMKFTGLGNLLKSFIKALSNKNYKYVVLAYLFTNIASALISSLGLHVFTYTFDFDNRDIAIVFGTQFAISILSQPVWVRISKKIDKKPSVISGLVMCIIGSAFFVVLVLLKDNVAGNFIYMLPFAALVGFGTGGLFSLPLSMIADTIDVEELNSGTRPEGVYYGCFTFFYKLSQSLTIFFVGILIDIIKFDADAHVQPESTLVILGLTIAIGSTLGFLAAIMSYSRYDLNKSRISKIQKILSLKNN